MARFIRTVLGDRDPRDVTFAHCHEHLFVFPVRGVELPARLLIDDYLRTRDEVDGFREAGGNTLVDLQPLGGGRHAELLERVSRETGVMVIAATGQHKPLFYPPGAWPMGKTARELADLFISEIQEGMFAYHPSEPLTRRTSIKAGAIKVATGEEGLDAPYRIVFAAAARAHRETGAPVITHTELGAFGAEQAAFLIKRGVAPGSIVIGHMDRRADLEENLRVARTGVFLAYDTIARYQYHSDDREIALIRDMVERGFGGRLLLGMDVTRDRMSAYGGEPGLAYIARSFAARLREQVGGQATRAMLRDNPGRALSFSRPGAGT
ncbi:MAG: phosphotriesterase family protein [Spirochaetota bacterium]